MVKISDETKAEALTMFRIGAPAAFTSLFRVLIGFTDISFLGHLGTAELAGSSLATVWCVITTACLFRCQNEPLATPAQLSLAFQGCLFRRELTVFPSNGCQEPSSYGHMAADWNIRWLCWRFAHHRVVVSNSVCCKIDGCVQRNPIVCFHIHLHFDDLAASCNEFQHNFQLARGAADHDAGASGVWHIRSALLLSLSH